MPFPFKALCVTTFERVPQAVRDLGGDPHAANHQNELIGTPAQVMGVYGLNLLTNRHMFLVRVDHWTLTPKHKMPDELRK